MAGDVRSGVPRIRKQQTQVPAECVPSTGYVPMSPSVPAEPGPAGEILPRPGPQAPVHHPLPPITGAPAQDFGPATGAVSTPLRPFSGSAAQPAQPSQMAPAHRLDGAAVPAVPGHPTHAVTAVAVPTGADSAAVQAVPGAPLTDHFTATPQHPAAPLDHPFANAATAAPAHELSTPLGTVAHPAETHTLLAARGDDPGVASSGCAPGCSCCCQDTSGHAADSRPDEATAVPDHANAHDPGQPADPSGQPADPSNRPSPDTPAPDTLPQETNQRDAIADPAAGSGTGCGTGTQDSPVGTAVGTPENPRPLDPAPGTQPLATTPQSHDPLKPFYKSEKPQPPEAANTVQRKLAPDQPLLAARRVQEKPAAVQPTESAMVVRDKDAPVTSGTAAVQPTERAMVVRNKDAPVTSGTAATPQVIDKLTPTKSTKPSGTGSGGSSGTGTPGSGTGGQGGKKELPPVKATGGGNLTFDEGQYKKLTGVITDMTLSLVSDAGQTKDTMLDGELPLQPRPTNQTWKPAADLTQWGKDFGGSVAEMNEKLRSAMSVFGNAMEMATVVFKDTNNLAMVDYTTFVTEFPDLNTGGGQLNPGSFGGGAGGPKP